MIHQDLNHDSTIFLLEMNGSICNYNFTTKLLLFQRLFPRTNNDLGSSQIHKVITCNTVPASLTVETENDMMVAMTHI